MDGRVHRQCDARPLVDEEVVVGRREIHHARLDEDLVLRLLQRQLRESLEPLMQKQCRQVQLEQTTGRRWWWRLGFGALVFHVMRHFPRWAAALPAHRPELRPVADTAVLVPQAAGAAGEAWAWEDTPATAVAGHCK